MVNISLALPFVIVLLVLCSKLPSHSLDPQAVYASRPAGMPLRYYTAEMHVPVLLHGSSLFVSLVGV